MKQNPGSSEVQEPRKTKPQQRQHSATTGDHQQAKVKISKLAVQQQLLTHNPQVLTASGGSQQ